MTGHPSGTRRASMSRAALEDILGHPVSDEQWGCICAPLEPFVIVAGAGTGKTTVMAARVLWLVASGRVADHEVLGLTFTNKAAAELAHRVTALLERWRAGTPAERDTIAGEPTIATYHSFARRLIDEQGLRVGIEPGSRLLADAAVAQLAYGVVCRADGLTSVTTSPTALAADVVALDANLAEQSISTAELREHDQAVIEAIGAAPRPTKPIREIARTASRRLELADLVDAARAARTGVGGLDFSDQMRLCVQLVRSSDELVAALRRAYRIVLLDEYQDTSIAQREILSTLFAGTAVTAVGDPLQAIYGWRSASVANIAAFPRHFRATGPDAVRVLSVNRRSGEPVLAAANLISTELRAAHPEVAELRAPQPRSGVVRAALLTTVDEEREWIAVQVSALVDSGVAPQHIAVLARDNDSLVTLQQHIAARGVPAAVAGAVPLESSPFAAEVLATLRVLADPGDNTALAALLAGPRWRIGPADLAALGSRAARLAGVPPRPDPGDLRARLEAASPSIDPVERVSLLEALASAGPDVSAESKLRLADFLGELRGLQALVGRPLPELVAEVAGTLGALIEADLGPSDSPDVGLTGLMQLVDGFGDADGHSSLGAFLAYLAAGEQLGAREVVDLPVRPGTVQLMTMHKAKGLEFRAVVLPHLCRDVFPGGVASERWTTRAHVVPSELRDDRHVLPALTGFTGRDLDGFLEQCRAHDRSGDDRLAYVAVTRARDILIASGHWWGPTQRRLRGPSPYLTALRAEADEDRERAPAADGQGAPSPTSDPWVSEPVPADGRDEPENPMLASGVEHPWPVPGPAETDPVRLAAASVEALIESGQADPPWQGHRRAPSRGQRAGAVPGSGADAGAGAEGDPGAEGGAGAEAGADADGGAGADPRAGAEGGASDQVIAAWDVAIEALLARMAGTPTAGTPPQWTPAAGTPAPGTPTAGTPAPGAPAAGTPAARVAHMPAVLTASAATEVVADPTGYAARLLRPMPRRRSRHADLGTAFHAWVEQRLGVQPLLLDEDLPGAADAGITTNRDLEALKAAFEKLPYAARSPAGLEVPFCVGIGGRLVRGRIDAVFRADPRGPAGRLWEVVDWKTSAADVADPLQLAVYRLAWAELAGVAPEAVSASFVFIRSGRVLRHEDLPGEAELAALLAGAPGNPGRPEGGGS